MIEYLHNYRLDIWFSLTIVFIIYFSQKFPFLSWFFKKREPKIKSKKILTLIDKYYQMINCVACASFWTYLVLTGDIIGAILTWAIAFIIDNNLLKVKLF